MPKRLVTLAALLALAACMQPPAPPPPAPPPAPVETAPGVPIPLGSFATADAARAAWQARSPQPGQVGTGMVQDMGFRIDAAGQFVLYPRAMGSGPPLRPPSKPPVQ